MSAQSRRRAEPALLPKVGGRTFWLILAILIVSFLATLEIIGTTTAVRLLWDWPSRLAGSITLTTAGRGVESSDAAAARAAEILSHDPSIAKAWVLEPDPADALAARIMGAPAGNGQATPPRLVGAAFEPGAQITDQDIRGLMESAGIDAALDDHGWWSGPVERLALLVAVGAVALMLCLLLTLNTLAAGGVRRAFDRVEPRVVLLQHLGATDAMLLQPFRVGIGDAAFLGSILGTAAAVGLGAAVIWYPPVSAWLASQGLAAPPLEPWDLTTALIWPLAVLLTAPLAAGGAAKAALRALA
jgi:cell division protein FtsX